MVHQEILDPSLVRLNIDPPRDFSSLLDLLAEMLDDAGRLVDRAVYRSDIYARETEGSTYMGQGIGIPHAKSSGVRAASVCVLRLARPMTYQSHGESGPVDKVFAIAVPADAGTQHLRILAKIARMLVDEAFMAEFEASESADHLVELIANRL